MKNLLGKALDHITECARIPSFSSYEERLHPYIYSVFSTLETFYEIEAPGNNLIFTSDNGTSFQRTIAFAAHLDKINHFGNEYPESLPVLNNPEYLEGIMDDAAGLGILLSIAQYISNNDSGIRYLFFFSEMEESKGLKEHPELLKNNGEGYDTGMGARRIADTCLHHNIVPGEIITVDTTPLFKGDSGVALYSRHWELTDLEADKELMERTESVVSRFKNIDNDIKIDNNTNDYMYYGYEFNTHSTQPVVSVALEPAINPYHQKGERVYKIDIERVLHILTHYIDHHR